MFGVSLKMFFGFFFLAYFKKKTPAKMKHANPDFG